MSWGEPQQPPYDPNNPYGEQQPYPQNPPQQGPQGQAQQPGWTQPYNTGGGYTQPMPPQNNPYGQPPPPYGQPEFPQYPTPPAKKGNGAFVAILVGGLVVVGGGIAAAVVLTGNHHNNPVAGSTSTVSVTPTATAGSTNTTSSNSTTLTAPTSVQGLALLSNSVAKQDVSAMKSSLTADKALYPDPVLAAYNDGGGTNVTTILVDQTVADLSSADQTQLTSSGSAADVVSEIMTGAGVSNAQTESTNASDGSLSCGTKDENGAPVTICVWYDQSTFGTLQYLDGTTPSSAAPVADAIRAAAEG